MTEKTSLGDSEHNLPIYSVGEISSALKRTLENQFARVQIRGEISGFKRAASGHLYFALKDADAVLDGVCWRGTAARLSIAPEDGMEVFATGRITAYAGRSKYQIVIERLELAGEGALLKLLEERKRKLGEEGLFDAERKQPLPFLPDIIGVVSSPTGAVIRDILHRLSDRFPRRVLLWPVLVQGEGAAEQVKNAITGFNEMQAQRPDVLIVARGGGSLEDLMAFNEEIVVRAAAESRIPLISAIGHETDTTLIDYAADMRAPTPTAAAEMAVPVRSELLAQVMDDGTRLTNAINRNLKAWRNTTEGLGRGLPNLRQTLESANQRLDDWEERLNNSLKVGLDRRAERLVSSILPDPGYQIERSRMGLEGEVRALARAGAQLMDGHRMRLSHASALLESYSYERVLERGFALVRDIDGQPLPLASDIRPGTELSIKFQDGDVSALAKGEGKTPGKTKKPKPPDDKQGSLL